MVCLLPPHHSSCNSGNIRRNNKVDTARPPYSMTGKGLRIELYLLSRFQQKGSNPKKELLENEFMAPLNCIPDKADNPQVITALRLTLRHDGKYTLYHRLKEIVLDNAWEKPDTGRTIVYVDHKDSRPVVRDLRHLKFEYRVTGAKERGYTAKLPTKNMVLVEMTNDSAIISVLPPGFDIGISWAWINPSLPTHTGIIFSYSLEENAFAIVSVVTRSCAWIHIISAQARLNEYSKNFKLGFISSSEAWRIMVQDEIMSQKKSLVRADRASVTLSSRESLAASVDKTSRSGDPIFG